MENDFKAFERDLQAMGINPANLGKSGGTLPPLPPSDSFSLAKNTYDRFYGYGAGEYWQHSEVVSNKIEDFKKCMHYLVTEKNEIRCTKCHVGWIVGEKFHTQDGKLYDGDQQLVFAM